MASDFGITMRDLVLDDPERNITSIKNAVISRLRTSDAEAQVLSTDYFNNTYAPDLVLSWPTSDVPHRHVYLRTNSNPDYLTDDIESIGERAIMIPLGPLPEHDVVHGTRTPEASLPSSGLRVGRAVPPSDEDDRRLLALADDESEPDGDDAVHYGLALPDTFYPSISVEIELWERLSNRSREAGTLVAEPDAFYAFTESSTNRPIVSLFTRGMLQGGRGVVDSEQALAAGEIISTGFTAAQHTDADATRTAIETADLLLDQQHSGQINRVLHAVWLGSGGHASAFPGATGITASLDADGLQLLLDLDGVEDEEFWERIAKSITFERLMEVEAASTSDNLQRLMAAAVSRLQVKSCRVRRGDKTETDTSRLRWFVAAGILGLNAANYRAYFSARAASSLSVPVDPAPSIGIGEMRRRARRAEVEIEKIEFDASEGRELDYKSGEITIDSGDEVLEALDNAFGSTISVRAASVLMRYGSEMRCDLVQRTASGRTSAKYSLAHVISHALPLIQRLNDSEVSALRRLVGDEVLA